MTICENCLKEFHKTRDWQKYCSPHCRHTAFIKSHGQYKYKYKISQKAREWKHQHQTELRKSNPDHFSKPYSEGGGNTLIELLELKKKNPEYYKKQAKKHFKAIGYRPQREWYYKNKEKVLRHQAELRLSNPEIFKERSEGYYKINGKLIRLPKDEALEYEMNHTTPIRAFIPLPEKYKNNPAAYFKEGIITLKRIQKWPQTPLKIHIPKDITERQRLRA